MTAYAYSGAAFGAWEEGDNWTPTAPAGGPTIGDTVTIPNARKCTIDSDVTIGTSPATDSGTFALTIEGVNWDEQLFVSNGHTLTLRGDAHIEGILKLDAGSSLVFDPSAAASPSSTVYKAYVGRVNGYYHGALVCDGTEENPCTVTTNTANGTTGAFARFLIHADAGYHGGFRCTWTNFSRLGSASADAIQGRQRIAGIAWYITDSTFDYCGAVSCVVASEVTAGVFNFDRNRFSNSLSTASPPLNTIFTWAANKTGGTRSVTGNRFDKSPYFGGQDQVEFDDNIGKAAICLNNATAFLSFANNLLYRDWESENQVYGGDLVDCYWIEDFDEGNGRAFAITGTANGVILETPYSGVGDFAALSWENCIVLPNDAGTGPGRPLGSSFIHSTICCSPSGESGVGHSETSEGVANSIEPVKGNIFFTMEGETAGYKGTRLNGDTPDVVPATQDVITPAEWTHNWCSNIDQSSNVGYGFYDAQIAKVPGQPAMFSVVPSGDGVGDAGFVDPTRNFLTWGQSLDGGITTRAEVFAAMQAGVEDFTLAALRAHVREGFTPTNGAMATFAHDGTWPGAVQGEAAEPTPPSITGTPQIGATVQFDIGEVSGDTPFHYSVEFGSDGSTMEGYVVAEESPAEDHDWVIPAIASDATPLVDKHIRPVVFWDEVGEVKGEWLGPLAAASEGTIGWSDAAGRHRDMMDPSWMGKT